MTLKIGCQRNCQHPSSVFMRERSGQECAIFFTCGFHSTAVFPLVTSRHYLRLPTERHSLSVCGCGRGRNRISVSRWSLQEPYQHKSSLAFPPVMKFYLQFCHYHLYLHSSTGDMVFEHCRRRRCHLRYYLAY